MSLFKRIVNESLLTELRSEDDKRIIDAINNVLRVRIAYNDKDKGYVAKYGETRPTVGPEKGKNERYILPVAYGLTKSGKKAIRAYQSAGSTRRGKPHWKLFLLDNILYWSNGKKSFKDYAQTLIDLGLNTEGDKGLPTLYAITPISKDDVQVANDTNPIHGSVSKLDVTPSVASQKPNTTDKENFVSAQTKKPTTIDNTADNTYSNSKIDAPPTQPVMKQQVSANNVGVQNNGTQQVNSTAPITKQQVVTKSNRHDLRGLNGRFVKQPYNFASDKPQFDINSPEWNQEYTRAQQGVTSGPVTKQQVDNEDEKEQIAENFKRMMDRMNNRYNDENN